MSNDLTIQNILPSELTGDRVVALPPEVLNECREAVAAASAAEVTDADSLDKADAIYKAIDSLAKDIDARRLATTRPLDDLKKAIMAAVKDATEPMAKAKSALGLRITAYIREEKRKADEERRRLEAEIERKRREAEEAAEVFGGDPEPVPEPEPVAKPMPPAPPPVRSSAVSVATRREPVITNLAAFLYALAIDSETHGPAGCLYGRELVTIESMGKAIDKKVLRKLSVDAELDVPGVEVQEVESVRRKGGRA